MLHGRLLPGSSTPKSGEHVERPAHASSVVFEQILSGKSDAPVDYDQDHEEWVVLLEGAAELEVDGELLSLESGDWLRLPRNTPHRRVSTAQVTSWLAVRVPAR